MWKSPAESSLGLKFSELRNHPLFTGTLWLREKAKVDGADGLWRIHDCIYDLGDFVGKHPGGRDWIEMTKGTDITEAFESHHTSYLPEKLLGKYFVKKSTQPRNAPFTFEENGFYKTLKRRIIQELANCPQRAQIRSKLMTDFLLLCFLATSILTVRYQSYWIGAISGIFLGLTTVAAHNFFHQGDNFRMYYFNLSFMDYREWRISHALSHHLYTNTVNDLEISELEPFLQYLPTKKNFFFRYVSWVYSPIVYVFLLVGQYLKLVFVRIIFKEKWNWYNFLPFTVLLLMLLTGSNPTTSLKCFFFIILISSIHFGIVGVNAAHHHPDIFHDGDAPRPSGDLDWGIYQLDAVMDRNDITGSHFLVLTNFGDHALHHLFPTIDHGKLEYLYPIFLETCREFGVEWRVSTQLELVKGQYRQLAKVEPTKHTKKR